MTPNDSIKPKDFYDTMQQVEGRIIAKIDSKIDPLTKSISALSREMGEVKTEIRSMSSRVDTNENDIETLKKADRGVLAIAATIGGAIGTAFAAALKFFGTNQ